jgi:3-dehydroquinate dehydratase-2
VKVLVIHGPNLDRLGSREPTIYGDQTIEQVNDAIRAEAAELGIEVEIVQTAREGEIIERLHGAIDSIVGVVMNPAAYAHTSQAIADAIRAVPYPVIEVHLSNIHAREPWRRRSVTAEASKGIVSGFGTDSYLAALRLLKGLVS